jgi:hypothetical protein
MHTVILFEQVIFFLLVPWKSRSFRYRPRGCRRFVQGTGACDKSPFDFSAMKVFTGTLPLTRQQEGHRKQ